MNRLLPWRWALHWQILLGLLVGALVGWRMGAVAVAALPTALDPTQASSQSAASVRGSWAFLVLQLVGDLFINGLKLIIVPLVTSAIVLSIAQVSAADNFARLGLKTLAYYLTTSLLAILVGLTIVDVVRPGVGRDGVGILVGRDLASFQSEQSTIDAAVGGRGAGSFLDVFRALVPPNLIEAARANQLLGLIVVSILVGFFLPRLDAGPRDLLTTLARGVYDLTLRITDLVLRLAPVGVVGLLAVTVGEQYAKLVPDGRFEQFAAGIAWFAAAAAGALLVHLLVSMPLILLAVARVNPRRHFAAMAPALATAFSTASSSATLPVTLDCVERRAGVSNRTASFVLPLGATVNMDGTALYECVAAIFICQAFGIELSWAQQFLVVVTALLTSIGVAGVPAASLVAIVIILNAIEQQLPPGALLPGTSLLAGMGLLFVFDRPLDMLRTSVNIFSDSVGAVTVARSEGEAVLGNAPRLPT